METLEELMERFKINVEKGFKATLMFNGDDSVTLSCEPNTNGYVGFTVINRRTLELKRRACGEKDIKSKLEKANET